MTKGKKLMYPIVIGSRHRLRQKDCCAELKIKQKKKQNQSLGEKEHCNELCDRLLSYPYFYSLSSGSDLNGSRNTRDSDPVDDEEIVETRD